MVFFLFFFSSRRRHTRWTGDWSSDVCSSDLRAWSARPGSFPGGPASGNPGPPGGASTSRTQVLFCEGVMLSVGAGGVKAAEVSSRACDTAPPPCGGRARSGPPPYEAATCGQLYPLSLHDALDLP